MKVLLVDDDVDIRRIGVLGLSRVGKFEVITAESGAEAIAKAAAERPAVVLLDMMMPGMDGKETLAAMKRDPDLCQIPVIFVTAKIQPQEVAHYIAVGARGVIHKPFDPYKLSAEVKRILGLA